MMIGEYPCCGELLMIKLVDGKLPKFGKEKCPNCGAIVWHRFSRLDPQSWTDDLFRELFDVDEEAKTIKKRVQNGEASSP